MLYTDLATCFGWTWEYIDRYVTLPRVFEIWSAWKDTPPLHRAFDGFLHALGGKSSRTARETKDDDDGGDLLVDLAAAGVTVSPAALDPELKAMLEQG